MIDRDRLRKDVDWLVRQYVCLINRSNTNPLAATKWSANHTTALGNQYAANTLVWYQGNVYISKLPNDSIIPTNTTYWTDLGPGNILEQELSTGGSNVQTNWNEANPASPAYLLNKPSTFPPSAHTHTIANVTGLQTALDGKVDIIIGKGLSTEDYTTVEKAKLASIAANATVNSSDATLLSRSNHTGTQAISTVTGLQTALDNKVNIVIGKQLSTEDYTTTEKSKLTGIQSGATANSSDSTLLDRTNHTGTQAISTVTGLQTVLDSIPITKTLASNISTTSTSAVNTNLSCPIAANETLKFTADLKMGGVTGGYSVQVTVPVGASVEGGTFSAASTSTTARILNVAGNTLSIALQTSSGSTGPVYLPFTVINGSTAGNVIISLASVAGAVTTMYQGSALTIYKTTQV